MCSNIATLRQATCNECPYAIAGWGREILAGRECCQNEKPIQTKDSASRDDEVARAVRRLERVTDELEQRLVLLERPKEGQRKFTVDHNAPPGAPDSFEAVLRHFRTLQARQTQEAKEFEQTSRRFHRKGIVGEAQQPIDDRVRMTDAGESPSQEFERKSRAARRKMLAGQGKRLL